MIRLVPILAILTPININLDYKYILFFHRKIPMIFFFDKILVLIEMTSV